MAGWWEQIVTMEPPEDRFLYDLSGFSRSTGQVKEGTYSAYCNHPGGDVTRTFSSGAYGWDLSAYPRSARYNAWYYINDIAAFQSGDYVRAGFIYRDTGTSVIYKEFLPADLATGWNLLSFPLSSMTISGAVSLERALQNCRTAWITTHRVTSGSVGIYIDDLYISTDGNKNLSLEPIYLVNHYERHNSTTHYNQNYAGVLEPISIRCRRRINEVTEASLIFDISAWDSLPNFMDSVRIFRNGMCIWDGVAIWKKKTRSANSCELYCLTSNVILQRIFDLSSSQFIVLTGVDLAENLELYVYAADGAIDGYGFKQQGFGVPNSEPCGYSSEAIAAYYTIPNDEFVHPWDYILTEQQRVGFDFEIRPPMIFNYWEPEKKRTTGVMLIEGVHFKVQDELHSGFDLHTACRAKSRGGNAAWQDDDSDTTAMNEYARLVHLLNAEAKSTADLADASAAWVALHKSPAVIFDLLMLPGGFIYPFDLGDEITALVDDAEYTKRIMGMEFTLTQKGEEIKMVLQ